MENNKLLIIIPAYNEEESIQGVFDGLDRYGIYDYADILVIDDASTDRTAEIAGLNGAHCISFAYNMGYGNALQAGYKFATVHGYDYIVQMDADGQHDACNVETIYKTLINNREKTDIVLACRFMPGSGEDKRAWIQNKTDPSGDASQDARQGHARRHHRPCKVYDPLHRVCFRGLVQDPRIKGKRIADGR